MDNQLVLLILGALLPPVIDVVNRYVANPKFRFLIAVVVSIIVGGVVSVVQFGADEVIANSTLIFSTSQLVYKLWYEQSQLQDKVRGV